MIHQIKPYPDYQDSGVPWLGKIPVHWDVLRAKYMFREVDERSTTGAEELLSVSHLTGVTPRSQKNVTMFKAKSYVGHKLCHPGDLVINTMWAWMGALGMAEHTGLVSPSYAIYRPLKRDGICPEYLDYLLRTSTYVNEYVRRSTGIRTSRLRLYPEKFLDIPIICPPHAEQERMVTYLRRQNRLVRRYIRAKEKLIALLEEQKQAIIHGAVTHGLDPDVRLKPSGVRWFGDVPEHWNVLSMRRVIYRSVDGPHHSPTYVDSGIPFISARNIKADGWNLQDAKFISQEDYDEFSRRVVPESGDVLYTKGGTTGVARAVDLDFPFQVWVHVAVLKVKTKLIEPTYLALVLNSPRCYEQSQLFTRGATNQDLGLNRMKNIVFAVPPALEVQRSIFKHTESALAKLRQACELAREDIGLIREYRTRLIADVVTGKFDVRQAAANLPDEAAELEDWDIDEAEEGNGADLGEPGAEAGDEH